MTFYSRLFGAEPAKRRPGYANFAIDEPPLKLVLIEGHGTPGTMNHLGVEVFSTEEVAAAHARLIEAGLAASPEDGVTCCYAVHGDACPVYPGGRYIDWELQDPAGKPVEEVRPIVDEIDRRVRTLLSELVPARRPQPQGDS